jgi:PAS domain S-box-containing protein
MGDTSRQQIQVLHVDDDPSVADLTRTFLQRENDQFVVETATDADEGLERINDRPPDCVLSDYNMPGTDGLEFLQAVREEHPDLPFILFTGKGSEEVASDAISAGATDYLQKQSGTDQYGLLANRVLNAVDQYRSEQRLRETREEYTAVFENAQNALILVSVEDDGFRYQQCNPRAVELIGRDEAEIVGNTPSEALGPENATTVTGAYRTCIERRTPVQYTVRLELPVGEVVRECAVAPVTTNGEIEQLVVEFQDITEQRQRQQELEEYETIIETLTDAVYVLDEAGRFTYVNDEFVALVGYDRETILGNTPSLVKDEAAVERAEQELGRLLSSDGPETVSFEVTIRPCGGDPVVCEDHMGVLPYEGDQFNGSVGTLRDITGRKERERRLTELNQASQDLLTADTRQEVADIGVTAARDVLDLRANAIHLSAADDTQLVPAAQTDDLASLVGDVDPLPVTDSIAGRVYQRGEPVTVEDVRQDQDVHDSETALRGSVYLPLADHGILTAGSKEHASFDQQYLALGEVLAGNLVAALDRIDREQTTRRQQQRLSLFFDESPLGAIQWDDSFRVERLNDRAEEILGYGEAELRGESWETIVAEEDRAQVGDVVEKLLAADGGTHVVNRNIRRGGEKRICRWHNRVVTDADGSVRTIFSKFEDVTEQEERKRELERYERLVENLPVGVFRATTDGEIIDMNEAAMDIYDAESRAQLRKVGAEQLYSDDSDRDDLLDRLRETGRAENELLEFETLAGNRRFVRTTLTLNEETENAYLEGILQDVTDRRELEREFAQIKTIAESLNDAVYVLDEHGRFTYVNGEFLELTGYAEETILGSTPERIKDEETVETAERQLGKLLSDEGPDNLTFETTIRPRDRDPVVCEDHMGVLPYEGDSFNGSVGVLRDVSERKRRERELRRERDRLDEFASVVSHDLRNPLNVAQGNLELLDSASDTDKIERIERAHTRINDLIDDLLTLARQGETVSDVEPVALGEVAATSWRTVESPRASLHVETDQTVRCDPSRLQQLLENLYRNAVEHGGPEVAVTVGEMDDGFYVEDTGPGIPENEREQVFDPGYSTATDGTGFGLRIVEQVAQAHGWAVRVVGSETGGARFEVTDVEFADR